MSKINPKLARGTTEGRVLSTRSKRRLVALITIGTIVFMLLAAEVSVRVRAQLKYGSAARLEAYYTIDPKINLRVPIANLTSGRVSINSLGFRGPEIALTKPPGTVRLAFLGASTTWCAEVSGNDYVWPHLVTASLSRAFPDLRFDYVNGGVPGYTMSSLFKNMQYRVAPLQPDVIVIYEVANNLSGELRELAAQQKLIATTEFQDFHWLGRHSLLWYLAEKNVRVLIAQRRAQMNQGRFELDPRTLGKEYRDSLKQVVLAAQQHAKLVALATFSIHPRRDQSPELQMRASESAFFYMPFVTTSVLIESYERYNQIVREVARETGASLIEGENEIPGNSLHFVDSVHFTDLGSKAMAERISRALVLNPVLRNIVVNNAAVR